MASKPKRAEPAAEVKEEPGAEGEGVQPKKKLSLKLIIMAAAGVIILGGGGATAYFMLANKGDKQVEAKLKPAVFIDVPEVLVNLSNAGSDRTQYLKIKIVLELQDEKLKEYINPAMPRVMDAFQTYLRELRPIDLEGSAGLYRLKEELTRRVNAAIAPNRITAVLFKEMIVQ
jgi:flagellar FliL protein